MYSCNQCSKTFTRGDNLKRHGKFHCTDKTARNGSGILFTPASSGVVPVRNHTNIVNKHVNDSEESTCSDSEDARSSESSEESTIAGIVADESDMDTDEDNISESDGGCEEEEDDYDDFWIFV